MIDLIDLIPATQLSNLADKNIGYAADGALIDAMHGGAGIVRLPRGFLNFANEVNVETRTRFVGEDAGQFGEPVTQLRFAAGKSGFIFHRQGSLNPPPTVLPDGGGLDGVYLRSLGGAGAFGIRMYAASDVRRTFVREFQGNGIEITAEAGNMNTNASGWRLDTVYVQQCGQNGVYVAGADANAGVATLVTIENCGGWGVLDTSFLGNLWEGVMVHACTLGPFKDTNVNARHMWLRCYSEGGMPKALFLSPKSMVIGGMHGAGIDPASQAQIMVDGSTTRMFFNGKNGSEQSRNTPLALEVNRIWPSMLDAVHDGNWMNAINLAYWDDWQSKNWQVRHKRNEVLMEYTTDACTYKDEAGNLIGGGELVLPDGFYVPLPYSGGGFRYRKITPAMLATLPVA